MASGNTLVVVLALDNIPPTAAYASIDTRNGHPVLDFDAATDENAIFAGILPRHYAGGGLTVSLRWAATTATSGNVVWNVAIERLADEAQDIDSDGFATAQAVTATAPATSGMVQYTDVTFTNGAQMDSLAAGESFRVKVTRDADNGSDTMTSDAELIGLEIRET
jgi:hypothetical protein